MRVTFDEVKYKAGKVLKCVNCNKRLTRQTTLSQTINPFNVNASGEPKSYDEIWKELGLEAKRWESMQELCSACTESYSTENCVSLEGAILRHRHTNIIGVTYNRFYVVCLQNDGNYWLAKIESIDKIDLSRTDFVFDSQTNGRSISKALLDSETGDYASYQIWGWYLNGRLAFYHLPELNMRTPKGVKHIG